MKILVLNGSPRKGNTVTAIHAFAEGAKDKNEIEIIDTYKLKNSLKWKKQTKGKAFDCRTIGVIRARLRKDD